MKRGARIVACALALVSLAACSGEAPSIDAETPVVAPTPADSRWLTPSEIGYEQQVAWGLELPSDFTIRELPAEEIPSACPNDDGSPASELVAGCARGSIITVRKGLPENERSAVLLHEMGHVLRHRDGHIQNPIACPSGRGGSYVMCAESDGRIQYPTPEDFDFVLSSR